MNRATDDTSDRAKLRPTDPRSSHANHASRANARGVELQVSLSDVPRGQRGHHLADALREAITSGRLGGGSPLPSSRNLADDLGVSRGVVVDVYERLVAEGHLVTGVGRGTRVAPRTHPPLTARGEHVYTYMQRGGLNPGRPDPAQFPRGDWQRAYVAALRSTANADLLYGDARGLIGLREELTRYLARVRSVAVHADQIVIVNGFAQGLVCITRHLANIHGRPLVAVEDPGSIGAAEQLETWGADLVHIPVDAEGLDVDALDASGAHAVVVTPAHQYPTGVTLAPSRRLALIDWAERRDALIVEDDYDAEYRYDRAALTSLHALAPNRVVTGGSMSKSLAPALRLGWLVAPPAIADSLAEVKAMIDIAAPTLEQAALAEFIANGSLDRHLRRTRTLYRQRRDALIAALDPILDDGIVDGIAAGLHVLIRLTDGTDEVDLAERAREAGLDAQPLQRYRHRSGPPGLLVGYANLTPDQLRGAIRRLQTGRRTP